MNVMSGLLLLSVRGVLLWLIVPLAVVAWILLWPLMRRRSDRRRRPDRLAGTGCLAMTSSRSRARTPKNKEKPPPWPEGQGGGFIQSVWLWGVYVVARTRERSCQVVRSRRP